MIHFRDILPAGWRDCIAPDGAVAIGHDVATTAKKKSNPNALALIQERGLDYIVRLVLRFKTSDPAVTEALIRELLKLPHGLRVRRVVVDSSNERFYAANLRSALAGEVVVEPIVNSETLMFKGEKLTWKQYLGNLLVNTCEDGHLLLPNEKWLEKDLRQVQRVNGSFDAAVDEAGNHADGFDAIKLGLHGLARLGGPATAAAAQVGTFGGKPAQRWWKNPFARASGGKRNLT